MIQHVCGQVVHGDTGPPQAHFYGFLGKIVPETHFYPVETGFQGHPDFLQTSAVAVRVQQAFSVQQETGAVVRVQGKPIQAP